MPCPPRLSKSRFQSGRQCALKLWHYVHSPELRVPPDEALPWIFDRGNRVGEDVSAETRLPAIFESAVIHENVFARIDVLLRVGDEWDLLEVKSRPLIDTGCVNLDVSQLRKTGCLFTPVGSSDDGRTSDNKVVATSVTSEG